MFAKSSLCELCFVNCPKFPTQHAGTRLAETRLRVPWYSSSITNSSIQTCAYIMHKNQPSVGGGGALEFNNTQALMVDTERAQTGTVSSSE